MLSQLVMFSLVDGFSKSSQCDQTKDVVLQGKLPCGREFRNYLRGKKHTLKM